MHSSYVGRVYSGNGLFDKSTFSDFDLEFRTTSHFESELGSFEALVRKPVRSCDLISHRRLGFLSRFISKLCFLVLSEALKGLSLGPLGITG